MRPYTQDYMHDFDSAANMSADSEVPAPPRLIRRVSRSISRSLSQSMGVSESSVPDNDVAGAPAAPPGGHSTALNACTEYELVGIVAHTGSMSGGHYYSFIKDKRAKDGDEGEQWFEYNDEHVRACERVWW